jgi:prepilin-type N-terminal cleavage/methylation domain-containing protein
MNWQYRRVSAGEAPLGQYSRRPFTLIELLVVVSIIAILAAMLLPALNAARFKTKEKLCINNQRQLGLFIQLYADDYDQEVPMAYWPDAVSCSDINNYPIADRGTQWLRYRGAYRGLSVLYKAGYQNDQRLWYCPIMNAGEDGGSGHPTRSWNPSGGQNAVNNSALGSYYSRYVYGNSVPSARRICTEFGVSPVGRIGKLHVVVQRTPAALWDSYHDVPGQCCLGIAQTGFHKQGYNVLYYDMTVRYLPKLEWSFWPYNIGADYTDLHWTTGPTPGMFLNVVDNYAVIR